MNIKILFDNNACNDEFSSGWGFSCLINDHVLFDTGDNAKSLFHNMEKLGLSIQKIDSVILSHDHRDHTGGLVEFLNRRPGLSVYCPSNVSDVLKQNIEKSGGRFMECASLTEIDSCIYVTGEMAGRYKMKYLPEQAAVIETSKGLVVVTGCAHPGIISVLEHVQSLFPDKGISFVLGGFHMSGMDRKQTQETVQKIKSLKIEKAGPAHCTGPAQIKIFANTFGGNFVAIKAGIVLDI